VNPLLIINFLKSYWKTIVIVLIVSSAYFAGYKSSSDKWETKIALERMAAIEEAQKKQAEFDAEKIFIAEQYEEYRKKHPVIKTKEVKIYVTQEDDSKCDINAGFIRLHDTATSAGRVSETGSATELDDRATTGIKLSDVGEVVANNYNVCLTEFEKLRQLQAVIKKFKEKQ